MLNWINLLIIIIPILVNVAFITLLERKILGYSQIRKGPNKVRFIGIFQPFSDAVKLFTKESVYPLFSNYLQYLIAPVVALCLMLFRYILFPINEIFFNVSLSIIFIYILLGINIYPLFISGWSSNNKYSLIGAMRAIAQTVSYEVRLATILIFYIIYHTRIRIIDLITINYYWLRLISFLPLIGMWIISCLAETNRTPFDFAEGESELVSGFNIEYGRLGFALIFMAEYARIIFIRCIFVIFFMSSSSLSFLIYLFSVLLVSVWIWLRSTFPRYRYDKLIDLAWKSYLPITLFLLSYAILIVVSFSGRN